jgi:oxygen-independent coproporphyrinogen-3 oxidase
MRSADEEVAGVTTIPGPDIETGDGGVYIHIPFCRTKCPYCSFNSVACGSAPEHEKYLAALLREARVLSAHPWTATKKFSTLFIGGGTPTVLTGGDLAGLVRNCLDLFPFVHEDDKLPEISVEMNPNTADLDSLQHLRHAGVNRLSIGIQSFDDTLLAGIGRSHTADQAQAAVAMARSGGFRTISIDLMYGLPGQQVSQWHATLEKALELRPEHMSVYCLTVEEGTVFDDLQARGELDLPDEDEVVAMAELTEEMLSGEGYGRYEISNYALPGFECIHNINYWENGSYIGLGAGAVSCFSGMRTRNLDDPELYAQSVLDGRFPFAEAECLDLESRFRESVIMALRMIKGVSISALEERFGLTPLTYYGEVLEKYLHQGQLKIEGDRLRLARVALPVSNQILAELV